AGAIGADTAASPSLGAGAASASGLVGRKVAAGAGTCLSPGGSATAGDGDTASAAANVSRSSGESASSAMITGSSDAGSGANSGQPGSSKKGCAGSSPAGAADHASSATGGAGTGEITAVD